MSDEANGDGGHEAFPAPPAEDAETTGLVEEPALQSAYPGAGHATDGSSSDVPTEPTEPAVTGDARVDEALRRLPVLDGTDVAGHEEIYSDIHQRLAAVLDDGPGAPTPEH